MSGESFILQRAIEGSAGKAAWFDDREFATLPEAERALRWEISAQESAIRGAGGAAYTGRRVQRMRVVELRGQS